MKENASKVEEVSKHRSCNREEAQCGDSKRYGEQIANFKTVLHSQDGGCDAPHYEMQGKESNAVFCSVSLGTPFKDHCYASRQHIAGRY